MQAGLGNDAFGEHRRRLGRHCGDREQQRQSQGNYRIHVGTTVSDAASLSGTDKTAP
jgi:hypothetical protein